MQKTGELKLFIGPMFSGKSSELIKEIRLARVINMKVLVVKPSIDNRYDEKMIVSHSFDKEECLTTSELSKIDEIITNYDVIIIDEGQFFKDLKEMVVKWTDVYKKKVIIGSLDGDFMRQPIGSVLELIPYADKCVKLNSLCKICNDGTNAIFSYRLNNNGIEQIKIGGSESYMPLCRKHYNINI
jgi:thymidine kinase